MSIKISMPYVLISIGLIADRFPQRLVKTYQLIDKAMLTNNKYLILLPK